MAPAKTSTGFVVETPLQVVIPPEMFAPGALSEKVYDAGSPAVATL